MTYIAHHVELDGRGLTVDGVTLPWHVGLDFDIEDMSPTGRGPFLAHIAVYADRVSIGDNPHGIPTRDTLTEGARGEALRIVRGGLVDVLEWLGEKP